MNTAFPRTARSALEQRQASVDQGLQALEDYRQVKERWAIWDSTMRMSRFEIRRDRKVPQGVAVKLTRINASCEKRTWAAHLKSAATAFSPRDRFRKFAPQAVDLRQRHDDAYALYREDRLAFVHYLPYLEDCLKGAVILSDRRFLPLHLKLMRELCTLFAQGVPGQDDREAFVTHVHRGLELLLGDRHSALISACGRECGAYADTQYHLLLALGAARAMSRRPAQKALNPLLMMCQHMSFALGLEGLQPAALIDNSVNCATHLLPEIRKIGVSHPIRAAGLRDAMWVYENPRLDLDLSRAAKRGAEPNFFMPSR